uniref:PyrB n=1 Tax=Streptomyces rugosporus TaxID=295838 RepID=K7R6E4_STRRG|nr:PyrB [Streptomyces rugosporus]
MADLSKATRKEESLWLLERLVPDSAANNLALAFQVNGELDPAALRAALELLVRRHEVLRTVYVAAGARLLKGVVPAGGFAVEVSTGELAGEDVDRALRPFVGLPFALDGRPLLRAGVFRHPGGDVACLAFHHLIYDIISGTTLFDELMTAYDAAAAVAEPPPELTAEVAAFHEPEPSEESVAYWRERMADFDSAALDLWCGAEDPPVPTLTGDHLAHQLGDAAVAAVRSLPRETRAPESVVLMAAFDLLLAAHGAGPDLTVGTPVSVRPRETPGLVGHHTNVLPIRVTVEPGESFRTLVRRTRDSYFAALAHADVAVDSIADLSPRTGSSWRNRLCRHLFNYYPSLEYKAHRTAGLDVSPIVVENGYSKFDLEFFVASSPSAIRITARYSTEKLSRDEVEALVRRYEELLVTLARDPDAELGGLRVWNRADHAVIGAANATARSFSPADVAQAVHGHARRTPGAVAVEDGERTVTYGQLWHAATETRERLAEAGIGPGDVVAIAAPRGPEVTAAVLGVWLAGAAYLPIDPEHPAQRIGFLLEDSAARGVFTPGPLPVGIDALRLPMPLFAAGPPAPGPFPGEIDPESPAYLIYTSGSTGRPKGALLPHRAISNIAADYTVRLGLTPADVTLWMTTFAFDMANLEHYVPLYSGGRIAIAPDEARTDGKVLRALIERHDPKVVQATPTTLRMVLDEVAPLLEGRHVVTGAEVVPVPLAQRLRDTGCHVHHAYGPTETTTWCTWGPLPEELGERLDVGVPIWNTQVFVLAPDGRELPIGVRGEVCIAGSGVALGYHGLPALNAERFGDHPEYGRFYRSGDLGRWRADGTLELFGRADRQVKLRGNRIELGEIEATLLTHPKVRAVAAVVVGDRSGDGRLVAFVQPDAGDDLTDDLWEHARAHLPTSAIPQDFLLVADLPTTANEKVDYLELERMAAFARPAAGGESAEAGPDDEIEAYLVTLWRRLLDHPSVTAESNFFTHGGHSLLGAQLLQHLEEERGTSVKLAELFAAPTPRSLAAHIRATAR